MEKLPAGKPKGQAIADGFEGGLLGWVMNLIGGRITAFLADLAQAFAGLGSFTDPNMNAIRDGQLDLNNNVRLLSPLQDYGSAYANTSGSWTAAGQFSFTNQIGPLKNCHLSGGRFVLDDVGLWDIQCQIWCDFTVLDGMVEWEIRVLRPDNSVFSSTRARMEDKEIFSSTNIASVVVPAIDYQVQIYINRIAPGRGVIGGPTLNRLTVKHISRNTTTGDTGAG